jgi:hypothetical protein
VRPSNQLNKVAPRNQSSADDILSNPILPVTLAIARPWASNCRLDATTIIKARVGGVHNKPRGILQQDIKSPCLSESESTRFRSLQIEEYDMSQANGSPAAFSFHSEVPDKFCRKHSYDTHSFGYSSEQSKCRSYSGDSVQVETPAYVQKPNCLDLRSEDGIANVLQIFNSLDRSDELHCIVDIYFDLSLVSELPDPGQFADEWDEVQRRVFHCISM